MAKPTIIQSLLGRPSQTYAFPEEKVYFSTKRDMVRIATETLGNGQALHPENSIPFGHDIAVDISKLSITDECTHESDSDSDRDVFYTPNTSPRTSMASSYVPPSKHPSPLRAPSTKTPATQLEASTSNTSLSSTSLDGHSIFSFSTSNSTRMTTPVNSDSGHYHHYTTHIKPNPQPPQNTHGYVDRDWAKDVRWLVPSDPSTKSTTTPVPRHRHSKVDSSAAAAPKSQTRTKPNTPMSKSISKATPSIMSSMTALLEEDELQDLPHYHPRSSVLISRPKNRPGASATRNRMVSSPTPSPSSTSTRRPPKVHSQQLNHRRSRSLGHASASPSHTSSSSHASTSSYVPSHKTGKYASSSADPYHSTSTSLPTFTTGDLPSQGTPGYTSLVLPRAPVLFSQVSNNHSKIGLGRDFTGGGGGGGVSVNGKVDLTRSGIAQTTMASVEVIHGLSGSSSAGSPGKKFIGLFRRGSSSSSTSPAFPTQTHLRSQSTDTPTVENTFQGGHVDLPLGFTSYRKPPNYVPSGSVLVQVWGVAVDGVDARLVFGGGTEGTSVTLKKSLLEEVNPSTSKTPPSTPKRSLSLRSTLGRLGGSQVSHSPTRNPPRSTSSSMTGMISAPNTPAPGVGYIPGRSFVGRILECGWEVGEELGRKGDWVAGLLDLKKCGALTEFIVVDKYRVHRVPYPRMNTDGMPHLLHAPEDDDSQNYGGEIPNSASSTSRSPPSFSRNSSMIINQPISPNPSIEHRPPHSAPMTLEELALLPVCGIPAHRAVRTFAFAFSNASDPVGTEGITEFESVDAVGGPRNYKGKERDLGKDHEQDGRRRRVLVLRGHDGAGAMAVQMLVKRGWRVCVHVPYGCLRYEGERLEDGRGEEKEKFCMRKIEERVRGWGGEEVVFDDGEDAGTDGGRGAVVRVIERLREDGDVFDAILDAVGGKEVWEASERLLKLPGGNKVKGNGHTDGKKPTKKTKGGVGVKHFTTLVGDFPGRPIPTAGDNFRAGLRSLNFSVAGRNDGKSHDGGKVGYAWVGVAQDVDWEGENVSETIGEVLRLSLEDGIRPWIGDRNGRILPFEQAPGAFVNGGRGMLANGGTIVVKIVD
ncbi:hypothetical protein BDZ94DRAFT_1325820 [Collybia nuda]|uniref:Uncharacterized protein n=1 Tax=Collybia nuda TaxID=64659 RepID=A0A9P6CEF9_9AGAR|nr:hypothetical protein BDZ94DRAFT_1325820 [Collybia nuda]